MDKNHHFCFGFLSGSMHICIDRRKQFKGAHSETTDSKRYWGEQRSCVRYLVIPVWFQIHREEAVNLGGRTELEVQPVWGGDRNDEAARLWSFTLITLQRSQCSSKYDDVFFWNTVSAERHIWTHPLPVVQSL